jgi:hypothetical protein
MTKFDLCPVCDNAREFCFEETVLSKYKVSYCVCTACGLLQTEKPYWLVEAYDDAIAITDTGLVRRNINLASQLATALYFGFDIKGRCLDIAGGYGMLVRLMRDFGFDFYWEDIYCENLLAKGFEISSSEGGFEAITAFEVMEHVEDPIAFLQDAMTKFEARTLIFSTQVYAGGSLPSQDWWYYSFETGQHISFYTNQTLNCIADKLGLNFFSTGGLHFFTDRKISPLRLSVIRGRLSLLLALYIRWRKETKVMSDHYLMVEKLK